jgi:lysophospholipase L1-like esterase
MTATMQGNNNMKWLLIMALLLCGCQQTTPTPSDTRRVEPYHPNRLSILLIGDSISLGYTPYVLHDLHGLAYVTHAVNPPNDPGPGANPVNDHDSGEEAANIGLYLKGHSYDIVHFNAGIWDMIQKTPGCHSSVDLYAHTIPQYVANLKTIVQAIRAARAEPIFATTTAVTSPVSCGVTAARVRAYNAAALELMRQMGVKVDDLYTDMLPYNAVYAQKPGQPDVHYTNPGYQFLADEVVNSFGYLPR